MVSWPLSSFLSASRLLYSNHPGTWSDFGRGDLASRLLGDDLGPCHVSLSLDPWQVQPGPNPDLSPHMHEALRLAAHSHGSCNLGAVCGQRQGCRLVPQASGCGVRKVTKRILADASRPSKSPARPYGILGLEARFPGWPWPH